MMFKLRKNAAIAYYGVGNSGKSTILNIVIDELKKASRAYIEKRKTRTSKDKWAAIYYRSFWIAVGTNGDTDDHVDSNFEFALRQRCTICVTASRHQLGATKSTKCFNSTSYLSWADIINIQKQPLAHLTAQSNMVAAQGIINVIDNIISRHGAARLPRASSADPIVP